MFGVFDDYEKQLIGDWIVDAPPYGNDRDDARRHPAAEREPFPPPRPRAADDRVRRCSLRRCRPRPASVR